MCRIDISSAELYFISVQEILHIGLEKHLLTGDELGAISDIVCYNSNEKIERWQHLPSLLYFGNSKGQRDMPCFV